MTPSELICLSGIALPPAIVPSRYIQGRGAKLRTWRDKFTALLIKLGHSEIHCESSGAGLPTLSIVDIYLFRQPRFPHCVPIGRPTPNGDVMVVEMLEHVGDGRPIEAAFCGVGELRFGGPE